MHFFVRTLNNQGQNAYDIIEARSHDYLLQQLEQQQNIPLGITEIPKFLLPLTFSGKGKISQEEVIELMENMHLILKSGLPLYQGLIDLSEDNNNKHFKNMLFQIADDIRMGKSLSKAFEPYITKDYCISLHPDGKLINSFEFSKLLNDKISIKFFVGGAYGLEDGFLKKSDAVISLGKITMSHKIAKAVLLEQIYRGFSILSNHPYHK